MLKTVDVATGSWRHRFNFEPGQGQIECCAGMAWSAGRPRLDFGPTGQYVLFGLQDAHSVSTWWSRGGEPVKVASIELGDQVPPT